MKTLFDLYREHQGKVSDKWTTYLSEYDRLLREFKYQPVRLLEFGIQNGGSLEIWGKYFLNAEVLVGCDIDIQCAQLRFEDPRINVVVGNAVSEATLPKILAHASQFDLMIDDGSHTSTDIVKTFALYFPMLSDGGIFVIEDLHCSYWSEFGGGLYYPYSAIAFLKRLVDVVNHQHLGYDKERKELLRGFAKQFDIEFDEEVLAQIHSIEILNSICVVRKRSSEFNMLGQRYRAGEDEAVTSVKLFGEGAIALPQTNNQWTTLPVAPDEDWERLTKILILRDTQLAERDAQIAEYEHKIDSAERDIMMLRNSTSWRVTSPLRAVRNKVSRCNFELKSITSTVQNGGGLLATAKKAFRLFGREGLSGIKHEMLKSRVGNLSSLTTGSDAFHRNNFEEWIRRYDTRDEVARRDIQARCESFASKPIISVIMPTHNSNADWLGAAIDSVRGQIYRNWELCIADDASNNPIVRDTLERYAMMDDRIKVVYREANGHISAASNSALAVATGEWAAFVDHDDLLPEHALALVVETINSHPTASLIYSDEDKIDQQGKRSSPYFKTDFNIDLLRSQNMFCHLSVYRNDLLKQLGGFRVGFEGSQDYDLALRAVEILDSEHIIHIPHILYHWRTHPNSTALHSNSKSYAQESGLKALREHLERMSVKATVDLTPFCQYRVRYAIPPAPPKVSIIIPTRNGMQLLKQCVQSLVSKTTYKNYEILIIDNGSDDPRILDYFTELERLPEVRVLRDGGPFNYSALNNRAVAQANGEFVLLLNNDIEVINSGWLDEMVGLAIQPGKGAVGACLWYPDMKLQHGGVVLGVGGVAGHAQKMLPKGSLGYFGRTKLVHGVSAVTAACLLIKKSIYQEVGGLDEVNLPIAFNDVDLCIRVRDAGYQNVWTPYAELYHHESATRGFEDTPEKQERFSSEVAYMTSTWGEALLNDPAYNVNLTLEHEDFSLSWPPRNRKPISRRIAKQCPHFVEQVEQHPERAEKSRS